MTDYAITWTSGQYRGDKAEHFNSDYPYSDKNNCANFVSQVLHAGGWKYDDGFIPKIRLTGLLIYLVPEAHLGRG